MWVITKAINQYNQEGEYFISAFIEKPTLNQLIELLECSKEYAKHILEGGGRVCNENEWYFLSEIQLGKIYKNN